MTTTPRGAPELGLSQAVPETTVNEQIRRTEAGMGRYPVADRVTAPPGTCADGANYIIIATATGAFTGKEGQIATAVGTNAASGWYYRALGAIDEGVLAYVQDEDAEYKWSGSAWGAVSGIPGYTIDTDGTLAANSDSRLATQKAVKTYADGLVTGLLDYKGATNCSANPNYPAASKGDWYKVSVGGKIGGASGTAVEAGDVFIANADNAGGTEASVGSSWDHIEHNILISDDAYDATTWNGNLDAPSKNAVRDKIESLAAGIPGSYSDEQAQDAIGAMVDSSLAYDDATPLLKVAQYMWGFFFTSVPTAAEVLALHVAGVAFTIPGNFSGAMQSSVGTNPTASFALDVQKNGATIGTITVGTGGSVTATTTSGTAKSIAAGDVLKIVAPGTADATAANMAFTLIGAR